jgi:hypothetical protein
LGECFAYLFGSDGLLINRPQLAKRLLLVSQILLAANKDNRQSLAEVQDLGDPLSRGK